MANHEDSLFMPPTADSDDVTEYDSEDTRSEESTTLRGFLTVLDDDALERIMRESSEEPRNKWTTSFLLDSDTDPNFYTGDSYDHVFVKRDAFLGRSTSLAEYSQSAVQMIAPRYMDVDTATVLSMPLGRQALVTYAAFVDRQPDWNAKLRIKDLRELYSFASRFEDLGLADAVVDAMREKLPRAVKHIYVFIKPILEVFEAGSLARKMLVDVLRTDDLAGKLHKGTGKAWLLNVEDADFVMTLCKALGRRHVDDGDDDNSDDEEAGNGGGEIGCNFHSHVALQKACYKSSLRQYDESTSHKGKRKRSNSDRETSGRKAYSRHRGTSEERLEAFFEDEIDREEYQERRTLGEIARHSQWASLDR